VQQALAAGLAPNFAAPPNVFVSVDTLADRGALLRRELLPGPVIDIYIMGEIVNPGKLEAVPGTTILQILAQAGGLTEFAAERRIELRRTDRANRVVKTYLFSYSGRGKGTRISGSTRLAPGDVIVVPERRLFE
jgi:polysaccharide export outer membrane protein